MHGHGLEALNIAPAKAYAGTDTERSVLTESGTLTESTSDDACASEKETVAAEDSNTDETSDAANAESTDVIESSDTENKESEDTLTASASEDAEDGDTLKAAEADVWDGTVPTSSVGFSKNHITSAAGLVWFLHSIYTGTDYNGKTVCLDVDVDLNNVNLAESVFPFDGSKYFRGTFDGKGHTIYNFTMEDSNNRVAMFRQTENAVFKNITFKDVNITVSRDNNSLSVLVGCHNAGSLTFENVHVEGGSIIGCKWIGALVGEVNADSGDSLIMTNCSNSAMITGTGERIGGLAGSSMPLVKATNCSNSGRVAGGSSDVGGIAAWIEDDASSFEGCTNSAKITGTDSVGGILGYCATASLSFTHCTNIGDISAAGDHHAGGLLGCNSNTDTFTECWNTGSVRSSHDTGGLAGQINGESYFTRCWNAGKVAPYSGNGKDYSFGGLAGYTCYGGSTGTQAVYECFNWGSIAGGYAGGLIGSVNSGNGDYKISCSYNTGLVDGSNKTGQFAGYGGSTDETCYTNEKTGEGTYKSDKEFIDYEFKIDDSFVKNTKGIIVDGIFCYYPILSWCKSSMPSISGDCSHYLGWTAHNDDGLYYTCNICGKRVDSKCPVTSVSTEKLPSSGTLQDGRIYTVNSSMTISGSESENGLAVAHNATVIINIPSGITLTVNGGSASGQTAGKAGIYVPKTSTLAVTGEGKLIVNGGNGGKGSNGGDGEDSGYYIVATYVGDGGDGGSGGGGGGAGIGANGGNGGNGGLGEIRGNRESSFGEEGSNSGYSGKISILALVDLEEENGGSGSGSLRKGNQR